MKAVKFFAACLALILTMAASTVSAAPVDPDALLQDMYAHPKNYIFVGSGGTYTAFYVIKTSFNVQEYNPPKYIISINRVLYTNHPRLGDNLPASEGAELRATDRFLYDSLN